MGDKRDLRTRFTPEPQTPAPDKADTGDDKLAADLAVSVGNAVKVATQLALSIAETIGVGVMATMSPAKHERAAGVTRAAKSVLTSAKETLPEFNGQAASRLTDLVATSGLAALRAVQQTVQKTRRQA